MDRTEKIIILITILGLSLICGFAFFMIGCETPYVDYGFGVNDLDKIAGANECVTDGFDWLCRGPVEYITVEKVRVKEVIVEVPVIEQVEVIVEKVVQEIVIVKEIVEIPVIVEKVLERIVEVPVEVPIETIVTETIEVIKEVIKEIPVVETAEVIKEVPVVEIVEIIKEIPIEVPVEVVVREIFLVKIAPDTRIETPVGPIETDSQGNVVDQPEDVNIVPFEPTPDTPETPPTEYVSVFRDGLTLAFLHQTSDEDWQVGFIYTDYVELNGDQLTFLGADKRRDPDDTTITIRDYRLISGEDYDPHVIARELFSLVE